MGLVIREPVVAGQFYSASEDSLKKEVLGYLDEAAEKTKVLGAVVPHAGYIYSGETAGAVYSRLVLPATVVLIGPNHTGRGENCSIQVEGSWRTPLGEVQIDSGLAKGILEKSSFLVEDTAANEDEHCIEVQIPFLQCLRSDLQIVPIVLSECGLDICREIGKAVADAVRSQDVILVASSDMTHYESADKAKEKDEKTIHAIANLDEEELISCVREFHISMCGYIPSAVVVVACKELGAKKAELIKYTNSGERSGDYSQVVGYAGMIIV